jgi:hypothetical protein
LSVNQAKIWTKQFIDAFIRDIVHQYGQCAVCKHNPPCESLQAELAHGVIEWPAGVFAGHGALSGTASLNQVVA